MSLSIIQRAFILSLHSFANVEATRAARDEETAKVIEAYRASCTGPSEEDLFEMRAAYGKGTTVVDIFTGKKIKL